MMRSKPKSWWRRLMLYSAVDLICQENYSCHAIEEELGDKAWCQSQLLLFTECPVDPSCRMEIDTCIPRLRL